MVQKLNNSKEDNMDVARSVIALAIGMAVLIVLIMRTKFHPALALVTGACVVGVVAGVEWAAIPGLITSGFGSTLSSIGLVIAFGCMMGQVMEESNAAKVMAHTFIKALRGKNEEIALGITGFLVSIPIFADSALIILSPLIKSISQIKKKSLTGLALATACCLNITHASVPPTPGPLAVVAQFGDAINLGSYILFGIAMGLPLAVVIIILSKIAGKKWYKVVDENGEIVDVSGDLAKKYSEESSKATIPALDPNEKYPAAWISFAPILIPVILILLDTVTDMRGVQSCGTVILITGAGGAFGNIIKSSGIGDVIATGLAGMNMPILLLPFLMAGILKLILGSGTVAMTTTATICAPILLQMEGVNYMFAAYAACIGSQMFSLHNDSFFWVLTRTFKFDKLDVQVLGYEGIQFIWSWIGFALLCIVNFVF